MVFDIKLDLTRKARLVADGYLTPDPIDSTYAGVVSMKMVRIALTYTALLGIDIWAADIMNTFVQATTTEKYYIICDYEFGNENLERQAIPLWDEIVWTRLQEPPKRLHGSYGTPIMFG